MRKFSKTEYYDDFMQFCIELELSFHILANYVVRVTFCVYQMIAQKLVHSVKCISSCLNPFLVFNCI